MIALSAVLRLGFEIAPIMQALDAPGYMHRIAVQRVRLAADLQRARRPSEFPRPYRGHPAYGARLSPDRDGC
jgi:hypothetical protein